ncbi:hypothetical protein [Nocardioides sp. YR527]|uniref:hypothetical protein n=1 Tax=Nocardioides sp. YR527 TaxID=1881028 RepID=UPI00115F8B81|nr:hypothetical protein [Nocardioides sp. YR527]
MTAAFVSLFLSAAAIAISLLAVWYTRVQAIEAKRANDLFEGEQAARRERDLVEELANRVRWQVEPLENGNYILRNIGTHAANDVRVSSPSIQFLGGPLVEQGFSASGSGMLTVPVVESQGSIKFTATRPSAHIGQGNELIVTWDGGSPLRVPMPGGALEPRGTGRKGLLGE